MSEHFAMALAEPSEDVLEVDIFDDVGFIFSEATALEVRAKLKDSTAKTIRVRINSWGGIAMEGIAIYNLIKSHSAKVEVVIDGLAASAASIIAMAGDTIEIASNAFLMIHKTSNARHGNADDFESLVNELKGIDQAYADTYSAASRSRGKHKTKDDFLDLMGKESWIGSEQAIELGLADSVSPTANASAKWSPALAKAKNIPKEFAASILKGQASGLGPENIKLLRAAAGESEPSARHIETAAAEPQQGKVIESMKNNVAFASAIGLDSAATEDEILHKVKACADVLAKVEAQTGVKGEELLGIMAAWKTSHEALPEAQAKLEEIGKASEAIELKAFIEGARSGADFEDKKPRLTKASADKLQAQIGSGEMSLKAAKAFVGALQPVAHLSANPQAPGKASGGTGALAYEGKSYGAMRGGERAALKKSEPELFADMREDWEAKGSPSE